MGLRRADGGAAYGEGVRWRPLHWGLAGFAVLGGAAFIAGVVVTHDPGPASLVIRARLDSQAKETNRKLRRHLPDDVGVRRDLAYGSAPDQRLDVYRRDGSTGRDPVVVWLHGGGWLAGDKSDWGPYYALLAEAGFTVVVPNYRRAPEHRYPAALHDAIAAVAYVQRERRALGVDPKRVVLAGDSAGAQLAAQVAALSTSPSYARQLRVRAPLAAESLRGTVLDCGVYDLLPYVRGDDGAGGILGFAVSQLVWAYAGTNDPDATVFRRLSVLRELTPAFPPTFVTGGNADPLTDRQSRPLAERLRQLGVPVDALLYPRDHEPPLSHEYQLDLDSDAGQVALARTIAFLRTSTAA